jgi:hypothetical protein
MLAAHKARLVAEDRGEEIEKRGVGIEKRGVGVKKRGVRIEKRDVEDEDDCIVVSYTRKPRGNVTTNLEAAGVGNSGFDTDLRASGEFE